MMRTGMILSLAAAALLLVLAPARGGLARADDRDDESGDDGRDERDARDGRDGYDEDDDEGSARGRRGRWGRHAGRGGADTPAEGRPGGVAVAGGPSVGEVLAAAYRAAGLDRSPGRGWVRRARVAGLVPWVTVRTGRNTSWQDLDPEVDRGTTIEVRATWRLDRLVFDGRELQVASIEAARRRERRQLASRVIRAYFHWRRAASAAAADPRRASRAAEAAAELDALTDGWFSDAIDPAAGAPAAGEPGR